MTYDRYDTRDATHDERSRWRDERSQDRNWGRERGNRESHEDRGFFERAGDEIASWFGDDDADRRRREDRMTDEREGRYNREYARDDRRDRDDYWRDRTWSGHRDERGRGRASERSRSFGGDRDFERERERGYRPMTGDYGRGRDHESEQFFAASGYGRGERGMGGYDRSQTPWGRDEYRRTSFAGSSDRGERSRDFDPHYHSWRQRHMSDLDRDYDDYRRENQSRFEDDFSSWRERRMEKRGLLGQIREHMEVVGSDDQHVGTVDRVAGDRVILTKSDPESGGAHHSLSCSEVNRVEGDRVILDCSADDARRRWRDESRSRALFEREDQGEMGPRVLDRSFEGTYR